MSFTLRFTEQAEADLPLGPGAHPPETPAKRPPSPHAGPGLGAAGKESPISAFLLTATRNREFISDIRIQAGRNDDAAHLHHRLVPRRHPIQTPNPNDSMMKTKTAFSAIAAFGLMTLPSFAAITVTNNTGSTVTVDSGADQTNKTTTFSSWSLNGGNTVAVFFSGEGQDLSSASFGGQAMTIVQETSGGRHTSAIAYLINPAASTGDISLSWVDAVNGTAGQNEIGYTPFALGGVGGVAGSAANDDGSNLGFSYTTSLDGGYVLGAATNNSFNGSSIPGVSGNPDTFEFSGAISGNFSTVHVHGDVPAAGSYTDTYSNSESAASVAFDAIPEPGAALLGGLGTLLLLRRRRA